MWVIVIKCEVVKQIKVVKTPFKIVLDETINILEHISFTYLLWYDF